MTFPIVETEGRKAAREKWVAEVCRVMAERFNLEPDGNPMAMIRMMAEVAAYGRICECGQFIGLYCGRCALQGITDGIQTKDPGGD